MNVKELPDIDFVDADKEKVVSYLMQTYTVITGRTLGKADPIRLFILVIASVVIMLLNKINYTGKQNLLKYAKGSNLDNLVALLGVSRIPAAKATLTEKFTLSAVMPNNITIPQGTRVSAGSQLYFVTSEPAVIPAGETSCTVPCICQQEGTVGNNLKLGTVTTLVDPIAYVASVTNTTVSEGGADTETDEALRLHAEEAPESFSVAGPTGAYEYFATAASSLVSQAIAVSPQPGSVDVYILSEGGSVPGEELQNTVKAFLSDKRRRPLTDTVSVKIPEVQKYDINMTYYLPAGIQTESTRKDVEAAINEYITWQDSKMGRDINPDKLVQLCVTAGAKRVEITAPVFTKINDGTASDEEAVELAKNSGHNTINYGGVEDE